MTAASAPARAFVALPLGSVLGAEVGRRVARALGAGGFRATRPEGLHLTLYFLGAVERTRVAALGDGLGRALAAQPALRLRLCGTGAFPSAARPRVLWIGVEELDAPGRLPACRRAVLAGLREAGIDTRAEEREPFRAHVTVARARGGRARLPPKFAALELALDWTPAAVELLESRLEPAGSRYATLQRFPFPGAD